MENLKKLVDELEKLADKVKKSDLPEEKKNEMLAAIATVLCKLATTLIVLSATSPILISYERCRECKHFVREDENLNILCEEYGEVNLPPISCGKYVKR
jgi:hypothetical protein